MAKLMHMPFTEFGARLVVDDEIEKNCKVVYKPDGEGGAVFYSVYDESAQYPDDYIVLSFRSVAAGESKVYEQGTNFANVEGSSKDHIRGARSWIELMERAELENCVLTSCCAEENTIYVGNSTDKKIPGFECEDRIVGGHVIIGEKNSRTAEDGVLLLPICNSHNIYRYASGSPGAGYYMKTRCKTSGLLLAGYLKISQLEEYNSSTVKNDAAI